MRVFLILIVSLCLAGDQCQGQSSSTGRRRGRGRGRGRGRQPRRSGNRANENNMNVPSHFSCTECREETMYEPYVCQFCFRGTEDGEEYSCTKCKFGRSKTKPFVCQTCKTKPTTTSSTTIKSCEPTSVLYTDHEFEYYRVRVANGTRMVDGTVPRLCEAAGMKAVCMGTGSRCCRVMFINYVIRGIQVKMLLLTLLSAKHTIKS